MDELILKEREFKENLVELINQSGLPAYTIKYILEEMLQQIKIVEQQQYEQALKTKEKNKNKKEKEECKDVK